MQSPANTLGEKPQHTFKADGEFHDFNNLLRAHGWQVFHIEGDQESYRTYAIRFTSPDGGYDYGVMVCLLHTQGDQRTRPPENKGTFRLTKPNAPIRPAEFRMMNYDQELEFLAQEGWEFTHHEDYQYLAKIPDYMMRLRFYRRPVAEIHNGSE